MVFGTVGVNCLPPKISQAVNGPLFFLLITGVFSSYYSIPLWSNNNYTSAHIGMASETPKPNFSKHQLTDSLTIKK